VYKHPTQYIYILIDVLRIFVVGVMAE
jgi:hypothetical protein